MQMLNNLLIRASAYYIVRGNKRRGLACLRLSYRLAASRAKRKAIVRALTFVCLLPVATPDTGDKRVETPIVKGD